jgi:hypothetical protein
VALRHKSAKMPHYQCKKTATRPYYKTTKVSQAHENANEQEKDRVSPSHPLNPLGMRSKTALMPQSI